MSEKIDEKKPDRDSTLIKVDTDVKEGLDLIQKEAKEKYKQSLTMSKVVKLLLEEKDNVKIQERLKSLKKVSI